MLRAFARLPLCIYFSRRTLEIGCLPLLIAEATLFITDYVTVNASQQLTWSDVNAVPARNVGLLLGARPDNRYSTRRIDTAAELYHVGKVKWLLVSDDSGHKNYDETSGMQQVPVAKGAPARVVFCDYIGFSTFDSVVCAKKVSGEDHITIIPQGFYNRCAIRLAKQYGIDAIGFSAPDLNMERGFYTQPQGELAHVSTVIDAKVLYRQPKYLGPLVTIGPFSKHGCPAKE